MQLIHLFGRQLLIVLISALACLAQTTSRCSFSTHIGSIYTCRLDNMNVETEFDFVNLAGAHKADHSDADVRRIDFSHGRMATAFPEMVFDRFPNLHTVFVTGNIQLQRFSIQRCERLQNFWFEGPANAITRLSNGVFRNCVNLRELRIHRTSVTALEENIFADTPNLQRLIMPRNNFLSLPAGLFRGLTQLEFLDLERNSIINFEPQIFHGLTSLRHILCGQLNNRIWPSGIFSNMPSLVELDINWSGLQIILPGAFGDLPSLEIIRIYGEIQRLSANTFSVPLPRLHTLNINRNRIEAVQRGFFDRLPALRNLIVAHNVCINREFLDILSMDVVLHAFEPCFSNY